MNIMEKFTSDEIAFNNKLVRRNSKLHRLKQNNNNKNLRIYGLKENDNKNLINVIQENAVNKLEVHISTPTLVRRVGKHQMNNNSSIFFKFINNKIK